MLNEISQPQKDTNVVILLKRYQISQIRRQKEWWLPGREGEKRNGELVNEYSSLILQNEKNSGGGLHINSNIQWPLNNMELGVPTL